MEIKFNINYHTKWGESINIELYEQGKTSKKTKHLIEMSYQVGGNWTAELKIRKKYCQLSYRYFLKKEDGTKLYESGDYRKLNLLENQSRNIKIQDFWRPFYAVESVYESSFFTRVLAKNAENPAIEIKNNTIFISALAAVMPENCVLAVAGNTEQLGNWNEQPLLMDYIGNGLWLAEIDTTLVKEFEYKLCIYNTDKQQIIDWNKCDNKTVFSHNSECLLIEDAPFVYQQNWKGVGVAIPVFSIRTNDGFGVGEFQDIKKMVEWCDTVGINLIQILPINETTALHSWLDSYPYRAISITALHSIYLNINSLGKFPTRKLEKEYELDKEKLNKKEAVDYPKVMKLKNKYYKAFYDKYKAKVFKTSDFKQYFKQNEDWLVPFAVFSYLRDKYKTSDFRKWKKFSKFNREDIEKFAKPTAKHFDNIAIHYYIQYNLHVQLKDAVSFAHSKGVALKGDIPIGISRNSVDAWVEPELFNLNGQAGAPPDDFAVEGQNWEFPTYNWEKMAEDGYQWWKKRLTKMAEYFDAYRIDHILGFFRIWEIPLDAVQGLLGHFKPALPLSEQELSAQGLEFDHDRFLKPYIRKEFVNEIFGNLANLVIDKFLEPLNQEQFTLRKEFDTQQKIKSYFENCDIFAKNSEDWIKVRKGLFKLAGEVLFLKDEEKGGYHPRIALHNTFSYKALSDKQKHIINQIYSDYFYNRHEDFWRNKAMEKLPSLVAATNMLVCGEDLGMLPSSVGGVMSRLGILSLEIQRMPKGYGLEFGHTDSYSYLSVSSTSTHDMSTIRGWWEENKDKTQRFFDNILGHKGEKAPKICEDWVAKEILVQHLESSSMLVIFPFQDIVAIDADLKWKEIEEERINVPSKTDNKWKYRMFQNLDGLTNNKHFNNTVKTLIENSGR